MDTTTEQIDREVAEVVQAHCDHLVEFCERLGGVLYRGRIVLTETRAQELLDYMDSLPTSDEWETIQEVLENLKRLEVLAENLDLILPGDNRRRLYHVGRSGLD